jgi:hypothetical protein
MMMKLVAGACWMLASVCAGSHVAAAARDRDAPPETIGARAVRADDRGELGRASLLTRAAEAQPGHEAGSRKGSAENANVGPNTRHRLHSRRRPHMQAMPRRMSPRQMELRQQQERSQ